MSAAPKPLPDSAGQAAAWFNQRRSGAMTARDMQAFSAWFDASAENREAYDELEAIWAWMDDVEDDPTIQELRERAEAKMRSVMRRRTLSMAAAGGVLALGGGWLLAGESLMQTLWLYPPPAQEFRTSVGQRTTVTLLDRSVVTLDTDTVVRARFAHGKRLIELERGRAFFEVAKDKHRPFIVAAAGKTVNATGTAFDVRVGEGRFEVTLVEGRVRVQDENDMRQDATVANMRPGWRLAVGDDARWRMEPVDLRRETSWHAGVLLFDGPLAEAAAEMNRYSPRKIVFKGEPPKAQVIGNFRAGDVEHFVQAVRMNRLARVVSETEDEIVLAAR